MILWYHASKKALRGFTGFGANDGAGHTVMMQQVGTPMTNVVEGTFREMSSISIQGTRTLLGAPGLTTRSKDATRGSWPYY